MRIRFEIAGAVPFPALDFIGHVCRACERDAVDQRRDLRPGRRVRQSLVCNAADNFVAIRAVCISPSRPSRTRPLKAERTFFSSFVPGASNGLNNMCGNDCHSIPGDHYTTALRILCNFLSVRPK